MKANATPRTIVGSICLYGNRDVGAGWIASTEVAGQAKTFGDGTPAVGRTFTEAVWQAKDAIRKAGTASGRIRIFAAGGEFYADDKVERTAYFGDLRFVAIRA